MSDSDTTYSNKPSLAELLKNHLEHCSECQDTLIKKPKGLGSTTELCSEYQAIIAQWAEDEGRINNIVDHDEFGNKASTVIHEEYPWRL